MGDGTNDAAAVPVLEATATLTALATVTERIGLGPLVLGNTYRHPAVVANWAATLDHLSGGRLVLGLGAGWQANEHAQYGIALPTPGERLRRLAEACEVIHRLLREPAVTFTGEFYELTDAICEPKPLQTPLPLLIGGRRDRMLGVVARWADEWNIWADAIQFRERVDILARHCDRISRDPSTIWKSAQAYVLVTADPKVAADFVEQNAPRASVAGTAAQIAEFLADLEDAGVDEFVVPDQFLGEGAAREGALAEVQSAAQTIGWTPRVAHHEP